MIKNFTLTRASIEWTGTDGLHRWLYRNENSGRVFFRYKLGVLSDIKHPGIYLGNDVNGRHYFMHNHYQTGRPSIVTEHEFTQGQTYFLDHEKVANREQTLCSGLEQVRAGTPYGLLDYNCQSFVNLAASRVAKSEDVEKWTGALLLAAVITIGVRFLN